MRAHFKVRETNAWIVYPWEHLGDELHDRWEFFAEKFPVWMLRENKEKEITWTGCLARSLQIGFHQDELPELNGDNFYNRLYAGLQRRNQELRRGAELSVQALTKLLR
jgi:hypothetical protein